MTEPGAKDQERARPGSSTASSRTSSLNDDGTSSRGSRTRSQRRAALPRLRSRSVPLRDAFVLRPATGETEGKTKYGIPYQARCAAGRKRDADQAPKLRS